MKISKLQREIFKKWKSGKSLNYIRKKYGQYGIIVINYCKGNMDKNNVLYEYDLSITKQPLGPIKILSERKKTIIKDFIKNKKSIKQINKKYGDYGVFVVNLSMKKFAATHLF
ncbi:MAG: hypothetical protein WBG30_13215 [Psychrilyobacter sp.]|uniref:hypothetical protein n=1 Tax=Psychrilyobacter sp. TaxID=2586924 RepID=UPI003C78912C